MDISTQKDFRDVFVRMTQTLELKKGFHDEHREIYEGKRSAKTLAISLPEKYEAKLRTHLSWGKTAVDTLCNDVDFDGFKNDELGFTRILKTYGAYPAIASAVRNSMISACAFVSVVPDSRGVPVYTAYTGREATGIWDSRYGLVVGLAINNYTVDPISNMKTVKDYVMFLPGQILKVSTDGRIIDTFSLPTDRIALVPFVYNQDPAIKPFGEPRINAAAKNALDAGLRTTKLMEIANDIRLASHNIVSVAGPQSNGTMDIQNVKSNISSILVVKTEESNVNSFSLQTPDVSELSTLLSTNAVNFANAVGMTASAFGFNPENGSFSSQTLVEMGKPYSNLVRSARRGYGESIKNLAITSMAVMTGQYNEDFEVISPVFFDSIPSSEIGAVADGLGKITAIAPGLDVSAYIKHNILGESVADAAMTTELPSFEAARKSAEKYATITTEAQSVISGGE